MSAASGFCSTSEGLCAYFAAHCLGNETILSDASKREMQHGHRPLVPERNINYGLGLFEFCNDGTFYYGHGGVLPGFITNTRFDPNNHLVISVLSNATDSPSDLVAKQITHAISFFQTNKGDAVQGDKFTGRFFSPWMVRDIVNVNGQLVATVPNNWSCFAPEPLDKLTPVDETTIKIEEKNGKGSPGEQVKYSFASEDNTASIRYAGVTMQTEKEYLNRIVSDR